MPHRLRNAHRATVTKGEILAGVIVALIAAGICLAAIMTMQNRNF